MHALLFLHPEFKFKNYTLTAKSVQHVQKEQQSKTNRDSAWEMLFFASCSEPDLMRLSKRFKKRFVAAFIPRQNNISLRKNDVVLSLAARVPFLIIKCSKRHQLI